MPVGKKLLPLQHTLRDIGKLIYKIMMLMRNVLYIYLHFRFCIMNTDIYSLQIHQILVKSS